MYTKDLFNLEEISDKKIAEWLGRFDSPVRALAALPELFDDLNGQHIEGEVQEGAYVQGPAFIGKGTVIHAGCVIEGPAIIGENVSVRPHANIRKGAYICDNCVIGHGADIKATLALPGAKIQDCTFAGNSLVGVGTRIGSGTILANRKFNQTNIKVKLNGSEPVDSGLDFFGAILGDYARLAANVVTSPGTIIGPHTWVGSGVVLSGTYKGDQLITMKQELETRPKDRVNLVSGMGAHEHI